MEIEPNETEVEQVAHESAMDPDMQAVRDAAIGRLDRFWKRGLRLVLQYDGNRLMALSAFFVAMGEIEETGFKTVREMATHFRLPKQTVNKCVEEFRSQLGLPPCAGQRSEIGRKAMKVARKKQLKGNQ